MVVKEASVVFIAPTQHGKSTTIDKFHEAQTGSLPSVDLGLLIGDGTLSCTKVVSLLPAFKMNYLHFNEWPTDDQTSRDLARTKKDLFDQFDACEDKTDLPEDLSDELFNLRHEHMLKGPPYTADVKPGPPAVVQTGDEGHHIKLHLMDTPGLDDSGGKAMDDTIMTGVLESLASEATPDL